MNNKGFAISGILYSILIIFVASISIMLYNLQNKKTVLDQIKVDTVEAVNLETKVDYITEKYNKCEEELNNLSTNTYLRYNEENNSIEVIDKAGNWVSIYKTSSVPIDAWDGYIYNNGVIDTRFSDYTFSSTSTITFYDNYIYFHPTGSESNPAYATVTFYNVDFTSYKYMYIYGSSSGAGWINTLILIDDKQIFSMKYYGDNVLGGTFADVQNYTGKHNVTIKVGQSGNSRTSIVRQLYLTTE